MPLSSSTLDSRDSGDANARRGTTPANLASGALFAAAVLLSALLLGGLQSPALCGVAALLAVAAFLGWFPGAPLRTRLPATIIAASGAGLTLFTTIQALPLPASLVRALSPASAEVWGGALAPLHEPGPAWAALSLDPTATRVEVLRGVVYLTAFLAALRIADRRGGARFLALAILGTSLVLAVSAFLHPLFGAERVFGIYKPVDSTFERHISPLLNANHLAAYLNIGFCLALGIAVDRRAERYRPLAGAATIILGATQIWVGSRGGNIAMAFGAVCVFLMARVSRRFAIRTSASVVLPALVVIAGVAMIVVGSAPEALSELNSADVSKVRIAVSALPLALRYPLFGVGRGAFEVAFPAVRQQVEHFGYASFTHPENIVVQWATEWGLPVSLVGFLALGTALRPKVLAVSSSPAIGAWSAIATTAVHNLVDFDSEVPAIGIAVATCAAMVVAGRGSARRGGVHSWASQPRAVALVLGAATLLAIAVVLPASQHEVRGDRADLYAAIARPTPPPDFLDRERRALLRHPSEAYIPFIASVVASRRGLSVMPWIERTLTLAPIYGPAHFVLAQQLERRSPSQARFEYRLAMTQEERDNVVGEILTRAAPLVASFDDAQELIPENRYRLPALLALGQTVEARLPATRERLDEMTRSLDANATAPLRRIVGDAITDLTSGGAAPWCQSQAGCMGRGLDAIAHLIALEPGRCEPYIERARLKLAAGDVATALRNLQADAETAVDPTSCWRALGELAAASKNDRFVTAAEDAITRGGCGDDAECAEHLAWAAAMEERRGNYRRAIGFYARAQEKAPERLDLLERTAQLASGMQFHGEALDAYRKLIRLSPDAEKWHTLADREKALMVHDTIPGTRPPTP